MFDLSKLTPVPWHAEYFSNHDVWEVTYGPADDASERYGVFEDLRGDDAKFIALARNAFDIQMRRGWYARLSSTGRQYLVMEREGVQLRAEDPDDEEEYIYPDWADDPFTALVAADAWYKKWEASHGA